MHRIPQLTFINRHLLQGPLQGFRFQTGRYETLAVEINRNGNNGPEVFPAIAVNEVDYQAIVPNDLYPVQLYHKINSVSYSADRSSVGDGNKNMLERLDMKMVVLANLPAIQLTTEQLEARLAEGFPDAFPANTLSDLGLQSMLVTLLGSNLNGDSVFREEYKGLTPFLSPPYTLFSMHYTIESKYRKGCFNNCDPACAG